MANYTVELGREPRGKYIMQSPYLGYNGWGEGPRGSIIFTTLSWQFSCDTGCQDWQIFWFFFYFFKMLEVSFLSLPH
jgi:hypothetical protein